MSDTRAPHLTLAVPAAPGAVPKARHEIRAFLEQYGITAAEAIELAVAEAVENAALHAYRSTDSGEIEVIVIVNETTVEVVVRDQGVGPLPNPQHAGAGYGVVLMEALADRFELDGAPELGTTVRMEFQGQNTGLEFKPHAY